jgi:hypothetical protein
MSDNADAGLAPDATEQESPDVLVADELGESDTDIEPIRYSITSYGADFLVDGLVRRLKDGDIFIPRFQRGYVWKQETASRFIESLILGLPVPGVFLAKDQEGTRHIIIDGQQRLLTILYFIDGGPDGNPVVLKGVQPHLNGRTFATLDEGDRRRLLDAIIHATIIKQDEPSNDQSSIYHIFERLNTGGALLQAQEIRSALYEGPFNELLFTLNTYQKWRALFGNFSKRMKDQELILRFLALLYNADKYRRPMAAFLNEFMGAHRNMDKKSADEFSAAFTSAIDVIHDTIGTRAFRLVRSLNAAVFDAVMYGVAKRLQNGPIKEPTALQQAYDSFIKNQDFLDAVERSTADERQVEKRLKAAKDAFAAVQ